MSEIKTPRDALSAARACTEIMLTFTADNEDDRAESDSHALSSIACSLYALACLKAIELDSTIQ